MADARRCEVCDAALYTAQELAMHSCAECAKTLGIIPIPPSTRTPRPCMRCNAMEFLRCIPREFSSARTGEANMQIAGPQHLTYQAPRKHGSLMSTDIVAGEPKIESGGLGLLEQFVCTECGFVETYCPSVKEVPVSPVVMTELINYAGDKPYR